MNEKQSLEVFSTMPVPKAILKNAGPAIVAMLMVLVYNLADVFFVGQTHDPMQVSAITLASQAFIFYSALGNVFGTGGTSVISRTLGAGNKEYAKRVSSFCVWGSLASGLAFSIVMWIVMNPFLSLLGANRETWDFTKDYLTIVAYSGPFAVLNSCCSNILRAEGQSTKGMIGQLIGNLTNIILDPVMIIGLGMDTKGAAIATVIGNLLGSAYYILYFCRGKSMLSFNLRDFSVRDKVCTNVLAIGIPASMNNVFMMISHIVLNKQMVGYGNLQLAGMGVATNLLKITGLICIGFGQGIQPLVGYCTGSGDHPRCKKVIRFSILMGLVLSTIIAVLSYIFVDSLVGAFLSDANAFSYGVAFSKIMLLTSFLHGIFYVLTNILQGFGAAKASLIVNISRQGLIYIPAMLILQVFWGMDGLVWAQPVADVLAIILVSVLYLVTSARLEKNYHLRTRAESQAADVTDTNVSPKSAGYIITIGRSFGAGGRSVGKALAKSLAIPYYDKELLEAASASSGLSKSYLEMVDEKNMLRGTAAPGAEIIEKMVSHAQVEAILSAAAQGPCVIVGRCADCILKKDYNLFRIFVSAPQEKRIRRIAKRDNLSLSDAEKKMKKVDRERSEYYREIPGVQWGKSESYDFSVNTGILGIQGAVNTILFALGHMNETKKD